MEYTNEILQEMERKKFKYNDLYSSYYYFLYKEIGKKAYKSKSENIKDCLSVWDWNKYEKNKILDLQSVQRCKNNRFCPNCKLLEISKFIHKFKRVWKEYSSLGYKAYMLTLTIPSVAGEDLRSSIDKLYKDFRKFTEKFTYDINNKKAYADRFFQIDGGIRVLEITYNNLHGFHPHLHCVVFIKDKIEPVLLDKNIKGKYSRKKKEYNMKSHVDIQISKLWSLIYYNQSLTLNNIDSVDFDVQEEFFNKKKKMKCLECDFRELDEKGIYEVFKYTFKDSDVDNLYVFKTLVQALHCKRVRQGFGILFNMKCEDLEEGDLQDLILEIEEAPEHLLTTDIKELYTTYKSYRKISRFNTAIDNNIK